MQGAARTAVQSAALITADLEEQNRRAALAARRFCLCGFSISEAERYTVFADYGEAVEQMRQSQ